MNTYEYKLLRIEPYATDADAIEKLLNQNGEEGFRLITIKKFWTSDHIGQSIMRNFLILEKSDKVP